MGELNKSNWGQPLTWDRLGKSCRNYQGVQEPKMSLFKSWPHILTFQELTPYPHHILTKARHFSLVLPENLWSFPLIPPFQNIGKRGFGLSHWQILWFQLHILMKIVCVTSVNIGKASVIGLFVPPFLIFVSFLDVEIGRWRHGALIWLRWNQCRITPLAKEQFFAV